MSVKVFGVDRKSKCGRKGIKPGFELLSINGNEINDVLDYRFYSMDESLEILFRDDSGKNKCVRLKGCDECDDLGLEFETYLMDKHRRCKNSCIFCFIDQLPKGLRESLYFKDDDSRLSFLFGNYITLTNLSEHDVDRIIKMHISPVNVSVHTMNPELRVMMMRNPNAGRVLEYLKRFSDAGISINAQLVLCPGINDGAELKYSLEKLSELGSVSSVAAVPVGLTKYREGLYPLHSYNSEAASEVIEIIDAFNEKLILSGRDKLAYPSDEFFQLAKLEIPDADYYCGFPQLDNGVGLIASARAEFFDALNEVDADKKSRHFALATGESAYPLMKLFTDSFMHKFTESVIDLYCVRNEFFGELVTVSGLITGSDLISSLKQAGFSAKKLLLPSVMFKGKNELVFLDDISVGDVETELDTEVVVVDCDGYSVFDCFFR